jgi:hypothetical protein
MTARPQHKPAKVVRNLVVHGRVEKDLEKKYSPEQIRAGCGPGIATACQ